MKSQAMIPYVIPTLGGYKPSVPGRFGRRTLTCLLGALMLMLVAMPANSELVITITEGADKGIPMAVVPFAVRGDDRPPEDVDGIIRDNLTLSGHFQMLEPGRMLSLPTYDDDIHFRDWRMLGQQFVLVGTLTYIAGEQRYVLEYELYDVSQQRRLIRSRATASQENLRHLAHHVSNRVYETITGIEGIFTTRLAFVTRTEENGRTMYRLKMSDIDGHRARTLLESREPILSPDWSPDGQHLVYVSFEGERPAIFRQEIATGERERLTNFRGLNSAPAWSPDGRSLLMTLSKDGSAEIYRMALGSRNVRQLTRHWAINTEGAWSPDGTEIAFTSDRTGQPQIYIMDWRTGHTRRVTFEGRYNSGARFSPDGRYLYFVHGREGNFYIGRVNVETGEQGVLSRTPTDESPGVAPNGQLLIYVTRTDRGRALEITTADGRAQFRLPIEHDGIRDPAWSPLP